MFNYDAFKEWCKNFGFVIKNEYEIVLGLRTFFAVGNNMSILADENGNVRIIKPNGSVKWYHDTTDERITNAIKDIAEFYKK